MDAIRKALGLADGADEEACVNAIKKLSQGAAGHKDFRAAVCKAVSLDPEKVEKDDEVVAAVNGLKQPPTDAVPRKEFDAVADSLKTANEKLVSLEGRTVGREAEERVANAMRAGKLTEAMLEPADDGKNYFRDLARDSDAWDAFIARQPVIAPANGSVVANTAKAGSTAAGGGRVAVINKARDEWDSEKDLQVLCNREAYVADQLREANLDHTLSDKDKELLVAK